MSSASIWVSLAGAPPVRAKFWSKSLKEFVRVRKVQMVIEGITLGIVTWMSDCQPDAPSMAAASVSSPEMFWMPAM